MKNLFLLAISVSLLTACSKNDKDEATKPQLAGQYKLTEILADPGDGSGTFQAVNSNKVLELFNDGTITSNGDICEMSTTSNSPTSGTYSLADSSITTSQCMRLGFIQNNQTLIIYYPCIEPCIAKFEKF